MPTLIQAQSCLPRALANTSVTSAQRVFIMDGGKVHEVVRQDEEYIAAANV